MEESTTLYVLQIKQTLSKILEQSLDMGLQLEISSSQVSAENHKTGVFPTPGCGS